MSEPILVVDDEPDIVEIVQYNLEKAGFDVLTATEGTTGLKMAREQPISAIVLDLMLPGLEGTDVCRLLKQDDKTRNIPILMLTAKGEEIDRVVGLELGADDYMVKPFSPRELVLRIKAILRRSAGTKSAQQVQHVGDLSIDLAGHTVMVKGEVIPLTATEFKLLTMLHDRRGRVQTRDELLNVVWGYDYTGYGRTVDAHVKRLREKLGKASSLIETVRGVGYRFAR